VQYLRILAFLFASVSVSSLPAQPPHPRAWLAGRYDGNRVIVYFDAVHFGPNPAPDLQKLSSPVAEAFFEPVVLPNNLLAKFAKSPDWQPFAIGESYDLILGGNSTITVRLTQLVAAIGDEQVGNDSYIGALATVTENGALVFSNNYYALEPHATRHVTFENTRAILSDEPVPFNIQSEIASQLNRAVPKPQKAAPAFTVQPFRLANGALRYYVRSEWREPGQDDESTYALGAWFGWVPGAHPSLHIFALEHQTSASGFADELPIVRNVLALSADTTAMIVTINAYESTATCLMEYRDGVVLRHMSKLQCIEAGE
jgi:hypothetical protein